MCKRLAFFISTAKYIMKDFKKRKLPGAWTPITEPISETPIEILEEVRALNYGYSGLSLNSFTPCQPDRLWPQFWHPGINLQHPQARGLILTMPFGERSGSHINDLTGNHNNGIIDDSTQLRWHTSDYFDSVLRNGPDHAATYYRPYCSEYELPHFAYQVTDPVDGSTNAWSNVGNIDSDVGSAYATVALTGSDPTSKLLFGVYPNQPFPFMIDGSIITDIEVQIAAKTNTSTATLQVYLNADEFDPDSLGGNRITQQITSTLTTYTLGGGNVLNWLEGEFLTSYVNAPEQYFGAVIKAIRDSADVTVSIDWVKVKVCWKQITGNATGNYWGSGVGGVGGGGIGHETLSFTRTPSDFGLSGTSGIDTFYNMWDEDGVYTTIGPGGFAVLDGSCFSSGCTHGVEDLPDTTGRTIVSIRVGFVGYVSGGTAQMTLATIYFAGVGTAFFSPPTPIDIATSLDNQVIFWTPADDPGNASFYAAMGDNLAIHAGNFHIALSMNLDGSASVHIDQYYITVEYS